MKIRQVTWIRRLESVTVRRSQIGPSKPGRVLIVGKRRNLHLKEPTMTYAEYVEGMKRLEKYGISWYDPEDRDS